MAWLEISLTVDGEMAEAVADVLARFAPGGVVTEAGIHFENADDPGTANDEVVVRAYLPADDALEETRQKLEESLWYLSRIRPLPAPVYRPVAEQNWMEAWKAHYRPLNVGQRLRILPAWLDAPADGRLPIRIDPGMAFGTGTHPTTQLALALLEKYLRPGAPLIDVGCGSGILSIAALKLGASQALGVDVEPSAIRSARENAVLNQIPDEKFLLAPGSVTEILSGQMPFRQAPLVLANILAPILLKLFEQGLADLLMEEGILILSGIMDSHVAAIEAALKQAGLRTLDKRQQGDWYAYAAQKEMAIPPK